MTSTNGPARVLNVNVGVLGHVDSGKTSLVAALSTSLSTAALDKHPQSKERGITLDLGFSSFTVELPHRLKHLPYDQLQFTLVDCPGHASLIRTIIGGVQIIDMIILVVDVTKGLQTQTAECLVIGEIATSKMVVALNKVDLLPEVDRAKAVKKAIKRLSQTLDMTKFAGAPMIPVAARPGGAASVSLADGKAAQGVDVLKQQLASMVPDQPRRVLGPFLFAIDHCFPIKGQGTVLTGTVLQGSVSTNDTIELPALRLQRPVRSMQMFRRPVTCAVQGDRVGICVTQLDPTLLERGLAAAPGTVPTFSAAVACVEKIRFYAGQVNSKTKFHISIGHSTVMAEVTIFGLPPGEGVPQDVALQQMIDNLTRMSTSDFQMDFDLKHEYYYQDELYGLEGRPISGGVASSSSSSNEPEAASNHFGPQWMLLRFDHPVIAPKDALIIGAKFDADIHGDTCRLAFYGKLLTVLDPSKADEMKRLRVYKLKERQGQLERIAPDGMTAICKNLFKKETDISVFLNLKVTSGRMEEGIIESSFGKSGKFRVAFSRAVAPMADRSTEDNCLTLRWKRYVFDDDKKKRPQQ